ncbi:hypothetical protein [Rhodococcus sp. ARP2]|uniref:hypothetical protein n=1 Tax=Rhodococcus sp. ARP2 TaxID=1661385 RepID=UPI0011875541|nr:hypothetical protein [Rhodococcus sp. ARP2]
MAGVEDEYTILINKGTRDGVKLGTLFTVESSANGKPVEDPDTGEVIGYRPSETLDVRVREVYEKYCVAETFRTYSLYDLQMPQARSGLGALSMRHRDRIFGVDSTSPKLPQQRAVQVTVNIGDVVREILDER